MEQTVTVLLEEAGQGKAQAGAVLLPLVYNELRALAAARMRQERPGHTMQPTALVHEAFLRLTNGDQAAWANRAHFFAAAAEAMRRILIEHARARHRDKRGGEWRRVPLSPHLPAEDDRLTEVLAVNEALDRLEAIDREMGQVVKLRYFAGLNVAETADALDLSPRTVNRHWTAARAWLLQALKDDPGHAVGHG